MRRKRLSAVLSAILAVLVLFQSVPAGAEETEGISSGWFDLFSGGIGTADCHTVRFMVDGEEAYTYFVADGETVTALPDAPEIAGRSFIGWYTERALLTAATPVVSDLTVFAKYALRDEALEEKKQKANYIFDDAGAYAAVTIFGNHKKNQVPAARRNDSVAGDDARTVLEAWTVDGIKNNTDLTAEITVTALSVLDGEETLAAWTVEDGLLSDLIQDGLSAGSRCCADLSMKGADGVALVKMAGTPVELADGAVLPIHEALYLTGSMPAHGIVEAVAADVAIEGREVLAAYEIRIYANAHQQSRGRTWKPADGKVQAHLDPAAVGSPAPDVFRFADASAAPERLDTVTDENGWIVFDVDGASIYAVAREAGKTLSAGGEGWKVTVTDLSGTCIPDGTELLVEEVPADAYLADTAAVLGWSPDDTVYYTKYLNIRLTLDGGEITLPSPVEVTVDLPDAGESADALEAVRFTGESARKLDGASAAGGTVSFAADAFGTFGFGAALRTCLTWTNEAAAYSLQAFSALPDPVCEAVEIGAETGLEEGLEAIAAYRVSSGAEADSPMKLWVKISAGWELNSRESVAVYGMSDGQAGNLLGETAADSLVVPVEDRGGFVLALDSGYRRKHIESEGMTLDGMMPKAAEAAAEDVTGQAAEAYPALENGGDEQVLAAWRIDLTEGGKMYLPDEAHPISIALAATLAEGMEALRLWRIDETGVPAEETAFEFDGEAIRFTAGAPAVYAVTGVLEKTVIACEGSRYRVTVAYGPGAGVPEGASLESAEIDYEEDTETFLRYADMASAALGRNALEGYLRLFDLRIVDEAGQKVEPLTPVTVRMELTDLDEAISPNVIHFADGGETGEVLSAVPGGDRKSAGCVLTFATGGFSVYAIVDAPAPIIEISVTSLDMLSEGEAYNLSYNGNNFSTYTVNAKGAFVETTSESEAASWYFEPADDSGQRFYIYTLIDDVPNYIYNPTQNNVKLSTTTKATFELSSTGNGRFYFKLSGQDKWLQHSGGGNGIRFYNKNDNPANCHIAIRRVHDALPDDAYGLNGKTFGIAYHDESVTAAAMMATQKTVSGKQRLAGQDMLMRPDVLDHDGILLVAQGSDITEWTFVSDHEDQYFMTTEVDGSTRYLVINGENVTLTEDPSGATLITVEPGSGTNAGKWRFTANRYALNLVNNADGGFNGSTSTGAATWLNLVSRSVLDDDDFTLYSARKASVSDDEMVYDRTVEGIREQSQIVLYTRVWNEDTERYDFYAVDHDGSLVKCYDSGDSIEWIGTKVNTAAWNFTEYKNPDGTPSYYYELQNNQYGNYLVPHSANGKILSDTPVGINLNGRRYGENDTSVIAWDDESYAYSGLKVEDGHVVACPLEEAEDFYVAVIEYIDTEVPPLTTVRTIDNNAYGITMKMIDFNNPLVNNRDSVQHPFFGAHNQNAYDPGLLSTNLIGGYPNTTNKTGHIKSLSELFSGMQTVNHLFLQSIHSESGYFEYDSTQHFAHLNGDGNFTVYDQIGQVGNDNGNTRAHGQFMPYNDLDPNIISTVVNRTDVMANELPDSNPRKGERLYSIPTNVADYFFGMEMEASFTQTASGLDAWGHDIIFEFSGDDDFWLYVDGELVLDLGGTRPAMSGSINFRTGEVRFGSTRTTLINMFRSNYQARGLSESEIERLLNEKFEQNDAGQYVFTDYTNHTMRMFYMERGAGASNLHMRFNLAAVRPGTFLLSKKLSGTDNPNNQLLEFPYQIYYRLEEDDEDEWRLLDSPTAVKYEGTKRNVRHKSRYKPAGGTERYDYVYFLKPGQSAEVTLPEGTVSYYVKECGILPNVYDQVTVNGAEVTGTPTLNMAGGVPRNDYTIEPDTLENRSRVAYDNHVSEGAMRTLNVRKKLYDTDGVTELQYPDNKTTFRFRLYLGTENDDPSELPSADQYTYYIKNTQNEYCRWNRSLQQFESLDITDYDALAAYMAGLSAAGREAIAFKTSMYGTISNVPAGYSVEVRDLIVGTQWKIEERTEELPRGYTRREADGYVRLDTHDSQTDPISGTMQADDLPRVEIRNQKGWGLTVRKVWTDQDFMESHDPVYFAVYLPGVSDPLKDSVRRLMSGETEIYYFFDDLKYIRDGETTPSTFSFSDFTIREVTLHPSHGLEVDSNGVVTIPHNVTVKPIDNGDTLHIGGMPVGGSHQSNYQYTVTYQQGTSTGQNENIRTDTVTNSRPGISLYKQEMNGQNLSGAVFTLKDSDGHDVAAAEYTSDSTGLITRAYLSAGTYVLTETATPKGYVALPEPLTIMVHHNHTVTISGDPELCQLKNPPDKDMIATVIVRNRTNAFLVKKVDADQSNAPMKGVHFALYQQVTDQNNNKRKDYQPMPGYEDLTTDANGVLPLISMTDLKAGTYYLTETQTLDGYAIIEEDVVFTLGAGGTVTVDAPHSGWLHENTDSDGSVNYEIMIPNGRMKPVQLKKLVTGNMAERSDEFTFTIQVSRNGQPVTFQVEGVAHQEPAEITLTHDLPVTLYLPVGANVQITEDPLDYTLLSAEGATNGALSGYMYTLTVAEEDSGKTITFTNQKTQIIDTGVRTSAAPCGAVLALGLLYGIWILRRRRRGAR